jgi:cytochrome c oxidase subunit 2
LGPWGLLRAVSVCAVQPEFSGGKAMLRRKESSGSTAVAAILALLLVLLVAITVYLFVAKTWWFPISITSFGNQLDIQFHRTLVIAGITFVLSQLGLAYAIFKFRDRGQKAKYVEGNNTMEAIWTIATLVMFIGLGILARSAWADVHFREAAPGAMKIEVTGQQFQWSFRFPGPDGVFGRYKTVEQALAQRAHGDQSASPWQLDATDTAGKDDIVLGPGSELAVPLNREVELWLRSQDVTHSFFVRELRLKQDAVPGLLIKIHFTATVAGTYELPCAELCGLGHYRMHTQLKVLPQDQFDKWLAEQAAANAQ